MDEWNSYQVCDEKNLREVPICGVLVYFSASENRV